MKIEQNLNDILNDSKTLKVKILNFKNKMVQKDNIFIFEKNQFDLFIDSTFILVEKILLFLNKKLKIKQNISTFIKVIRETIIKILEKLSKSNQTFSNSKLLEKRLDEQQEFIKHSVKENLELKKDISKINASLNKLLGKPNEVLKNGNPEYLGHNSNSRVDFYQEENLRLGNELVETKKKFEILKNEVEKYEKQRSSLISKINSVNDALKDTNVLTNVFENNINEKKVNILDHSKIKKINFEDINDKIKNIFENKT